MSWFNSLTGALGAGQSGNTNAGSNSGSAQSNNGGSSGQSNTFDNAGNPVNASNGGTNDSGDSGASKNGTQNESSTGTKAQSQSIEDLLFAPVEPSAKSNSQTDLSPKPNAGPGDQELAPGLTSAKLVQNLQSVNFMGTIPKETLTAAMNGDHDAFSQVISSVAQVSAAIAIQQSIAASNSAMDKRFTDFDGNIANKIGETKYSDILADSRFSSPFVKPLAENLIGRLRERDSSITPEQIKQVLPNLIQHAMKSFGAEGGDLGTKPNPNARTQPREVKFDELFN